MRGATSNCVDDNSRFVPWRNANLYSAGNPPVITIVLSAVLFCGETKLSRNFAGRRAFSIKISLYAPKTDALTGKWNPPAVTKKT
jgi:hypothetical protein